MKKTIKTTAVVCLLTLFALLVGCSSSTTAAMTATDYMDLGYQYLSELNYEEAIVAFEKAIEIDPMLVEAYEVMAVTYVELGQPEKAIAILQQGAELTKDATLAQYATDLGMLPLLAHYLSNTATQSDTTAPEEEEANTQYLAELDTALTNLSDYMVEASVSNNLLSLSTYLADCTTFAPMVETLIQEDMGDVGDCLYLVEMESGTMGIYLLANDRWAIYYGDMDLGMRQGEGAWLCYIDDYFQYTLCTWVDDQPTGTAQMIERDIWEDGIYTTTTTGILVNGLWDGETTREWQMGDWGEIFEVTVRTLSNGVVIPWDIIIEDGETMYVLSYFNEVSEVTYDDPSLWGISGIAGYGEIYGF